MKFFDMIQTDAKRQRVETRVAHKLLEDNAHENVVLEMRRHSYKNTVV